MKNSLLFLLYSTLVLMLNGCSDNRYTPIPPNPSCNYNLSGHDRIFCIQETKDGGFIMAGSTESYPELGYEALLIKVSTNLDCEWVKHLGGDYFDEAVYIRELDDGFLILGRQWVVNKENTDIWLIRTNTSGDIIWEYTYGGPDNDYGVMFDITDEGKYFITGKHGDYATLIMTDENGNKEWFYDSIECKNPCFGEKNSNGEFVIIGNHAYNDIKYVKVNLNGDIIDSKILDFGHSETAQVANKCGGGYIIAGTTDFTPQTLKSGAILSKIDLEGNKIWDVAYSADDVGLCSVFQTHDGKYVFVGKSDDPTWADKWYCDGWFVIANPDGKKEFERYFEPPWGRYRSIKAVVQARDNNFVLVIVHSNMAVTEDISLIKLDEKGKNILIRK